MCTRGSDMIVQQGMTIQTVESYNSTYQSFTMGSGGEGDVSGVLASITPKSYGSRFKIRFQLPTYTDSTQAGGNSNPYHGLYIYRRINGGSWTRANMLGLDDSGNRQVHMEISAYRNGASDDAWREGTRYRTKMNQGFIHDKFRYDLGDTIEYKMTIVTNGGTALINIGPAYANSQAIYPSSNYGLTVEEISGGFIPQSGVTYDGSTAAQAAPSAKYIKDITGTTTSGLYWILINNVPTQLYCDMSSINGGGWTLIGKSGGGSWHNPDGWLKSNISASSLQNTTNLSTNGYACIDARVLSAEMSREVAISNAALDRWVFAPIHTQATPSTIYNHKQGSAIIFEDTDNNSGVVTGSEQVTATAWNGGTTTSYVNKWMVMPLGGHGGSTPCWSSNQRGNTATGDYAMAVACANTSHNGFTASNNFNGQDAPYDATWPNTSYSSGHFLGCVWVR